MIAVPCAVNRRDNNMRVAMMLGYLRSWQFAHGGSPSCGAPEVDILLKTVSVPSSCGQHSVMRTKGSKATASHARPKNNNSALVGMEGFCHPRTWVTDPPASFGVTVQAHILSAPASRRRYCSCSDVGAHSPRPATISELLSLQIQLENLVDTHK